MTYAFAGIERERHPEEPPKAASRRTHGADPAKLGDCPLAELLDLNIATPQFSPGMRAAEEAMQARCAVGLNRAG